MWELDRSGLECVWERFGGHGTYVGCLEGAAEDGDGVVLGGNIVERLRSAKAMSVIVVNENWRVGLFLYPWLKAGGLFRSRCFG